MNQIQNLINERKQHLLKLKNAKEKSLKTSPSGTLRITCHNNTPRYYFREDSKDFCGRYIPRQDIHIAKALAQRDYDKKLLLRISSELSAIEKYLSSLPKELPEELFSSLHPARKSLVTPISQSDEQFIYDWESLSYPHKPFSDILPEHYTAKGERVRSKSEVLIANSFIAAKIPYRYECPLHLSGFGTIHPDFTVLNVRNRKEYYWEHLGKMDEQAYSEQALQRITAYEENGIFPGDRLIITYETKKKPLNQTLIDINIEKYLK